jgi:hypothetical protein
MKSFNLSNSDHTAAGLQAIIVTRRNHECESAQAELDAVQRRTKTEVGQERYGDKKDELMKWADQWHQKLAQETPKDKTC